MENAVRELLQEYKVKSPAELPFNFTAWRLQKLEDIDHEVFDHHFGALRAAYLSQRRIQDALGIFAPVLPLRSISMALSGTDLLHHDRYTSSAEDHRRTMVTKMNDYLRSAGTPQSGQGVPGTAGEAVFATVSPFTYTQPSLAEVLNEYKVALMLLAAWAVVAVGLGLAAVGRLRPGQQ
jgi:ABC-2 type transport system permease protein